jgi:hypothetical protein
MPTFTHLRLVRPAGQIELETPNRLDLRNRLGVDSLPGIDRLSEDAAAGMTVEQFANTYCLIDSASDTPAARAARPWCAGRFIVTTSTAPTPNRDALQARLGVPSLPPLSMLSEVLAGTITDAEYNAQFCLPITVDGVTRYPAWCIPPASPPPAPAPPPGPGPTPISPLIPGYSAGRLPPAQHYPGWIGVGYILGSEKPFLLGLPPDDYYRMIDKLAQGGPQAFHQALRIEATRWGVPDPLVSVSGLDTILAAQQADYIGRMSPAPRPEPGLGPSHGPAPVSHSGAFTPIAVLVGIGAVLYWFWPKSKPT